MVDGWALQAICDHLEAVTYGEINRLLINVPPGFMKSLMTNCLWPAWEWGAMDLGEARYVSFSYAAHLTERDNGRFRDLVRSAEFKELWGHRFILTGDGKITVANDKMGWKFASSVGGVGTGERGDRVLVDDPHNVSQAESELVRTGTVRWFRESIQNRLNDLDKSVIVVIMQRVHEEDVSGIILTHYPDYVHLCIPMEYDSERHCETPIWSDPRRTEGELAWPERFSAQSLKTFKVQSFLWSGQYQQSPAPRGGGIIKRDWWEPFLPTRAKPNAKPIWEMPAFDHIVASIDTAYTEKQENDPSALTVWGVYTNENGIPKALLIDAWAERLEINALVTKVAATCKKYTVDRLLIEAKASGISVSQELKRLHRTAGFSVQLVDPKRQDKTARAYSVQHVFEEGIVQALFVKDEDGTVWPETQAGLVIDQISVFPRGAHDDLVDSTVQALRYLRQLGLLTRADERAEDVAELGRYKGRPPAPIYPV